MLSPMAYAVLGVYKNPNEYANKGVETFSFYAGKLGQAAVSTAKKANEYADYAHQNHQAIYEFAFVNPKEGINAVNVSSDHKFVMAVKTAAVVALTFAVAQAAIGITILSGVASILGGAAYYATETFRYQNDLEYKMSAYAAYDAQQWVEASVDQLKKEMQ